MDHEEWPLYLVRKTEEYRQKSDEYQRKRAEFARKAAMCWLAALVVCVVGMTAVVVMAMLGI